MNTKTTKRVLYTAIALACFNLTMLTSCGNEAEAPKTEEAAPATAEPAAATTPATEAATAAPVAAGDSMESAEEKTTDPAKKGNGGGN